jgi:predicted MPP superfamily phosphohydrolase
MITKYKLKPPPILLFIISCWIIAFLLIVMVCTIFFHHGNISLNMLTMIAFIIFLILAPFADKIKFFGIEFNRFKENNQKNIRNL